MGVQLLDKTRKINKLLHNNSSSKVVFNDICEVLTGILDSDILVISKKGKVLGSSVCRGVDELQELVVDEVGGYIDSSKCPSISAETKTALSRITFVNGGRA